MNTMTNGAMIGLLTVVGIFYDVVAYICWGVDGTLSKAMQQIGVEWPIVLVVYGGLGAHFFCPRGVPLWSWAELRPPVLLTIGWIAFRLAWTQAPMQ